MNAYHRVRDALGDRVTREHDHTLSARCPAHADENASLSVTDDTDKVLLYCHVGCTLDEITHALGLKTVDLFNAKKAARQMVATYDYVADDGTLLFQKVRYWPKDFLARRPEAGGGWSYTLKGIKERPLYNLPAVRAAAADGTRVLIVEGEKDVDTATRLGFTATCNFDGAAKEGQRPKWRDREAKQLAGVTEVVVLPDNDAPGEAHAAEIARTLMSTTKVRIVRLPGLPPKGDFTDWVTAGGTSEQLTALIEATAPTTHLAAASEPAAEDDAHPLGTDITEDGLALSFTDAHRDTMRFCATLGGWQVYNGVLWRKDDLRQAYSRSRNLSRDVAARSGGSEKQKAKLRSASVVNAIVSLASSDPVHAIRQADFDADPWLLNTPGGVVDLRTGGLRAGKPTDYCTKVAAVTPAGDAPRWRQFIDEVTGGDVALRDYLQRLAGYWLTGHTSEHALVFVYGTGGNGKSVFLNAVLGMLQDYGTQAPMALFTEQKHEGHPTELAMLRGARLVVATETEEGRPWAESRLKVMTGGDPITARFMRGDFFTYQPQFKPVIAGNHRPRFRNPDEAIRRRLHLIPFTQRFAKPDRDLPNKLKDEAAGILAWAVEGCLAWQSMGLQPPEAVRVATADYLEAEDTFGTWLADCTELDARAFTPVAALFDAWTTWAEGRGEYVKGIRFVGEELTKRGFVKEKRGGIRGYRGLRLAFHEGVTASVGQVGRMGQGSPLSTSYARAHDAPAPAPAQRRNTEPVSHLSRVSKVLVTMVNGQQLTLDADDRDLTEMSHMIASVEPIRDAA